jgi:hypothetical protein
MLCCSNAAGVIKALHVPGPTPAPLSSPIQVLSTTFAGTVQDSMVSVIRKAGKLVELVLCQVRCLQESSARSEQMTQTDTGTRVYTLLLTWAGN